MGHIIFNLADGDRDRAFSLLRAETWPVGREERHRDALAPDDLALFFVAVTREFVGRAKLRSAFLDRVPIDAADAGRAAGPVLLADIEEWPRGVPLDVAVRRIDPTRSNPYVQANAAGFRAGVVRITEREYEIVLALRDEARDAGGQASASCGGA